MKEKIIEILEQWYPHYKHKLRNDLLADEILALFNKESEYVIVEKVIPVRDLGEGFVVTAYREPADYAGIDPVKWGMITTWSDAERELVSEKGWKYYKPKDCFTDENTYFEDKEGIVDTEIIK